MAQRVTDKTEKESRFEKAQFQEGNILFSLSTVMYRLLILSGGLFNLSFYSGEKILCYHGPLIYEGKCIHLKEVETKFEYFIHYNGWSKK